MDVNYAYGMIKEVLKVWLYIIVVGGYSDGQGRSYKDKSKLSNDSFSQHSCSKFVGIFLWCSSIPKRQTIFHQLGSVVVGSTSPYSLK